MSKKLSCCVFLVLLSSPAFAENYGADKTHSTPNPPNRASTNSPQGTTANPNAAGGIITGLPNGGGGINQIRDPKHPMNFCREHTC